MRQEPGKNLAIIGTIKVLDRLSIRSRFLSLIIKPLNAPAPLLAASN